MGNAAVDETPYTESGYVRVTWDNSDESANWYQWRVYRRLTGASTWTLIHTVSTQAASYTHDDYIAPANFESEYAVVEATSNDGGQTVAEGSYNPIAVTPVSDNYWLIHPTDPSYNVRLRHVTSDSFVDEGEEAVLHVIGRGRKVDRGEEWGVAGELSAKFRDIAGGPSGRAQIEEFLALKKVATDIYLRNPFGDVWHVTLGGSASLERESGIGIREHATASISYYEVY